MSIVYLAAGLALALSAGAHGASWDEAVQGDLSNNHLAPTPLTLNLGANPLHGSFGQGDLDYVAVTVAPGQALSALLLGPGNVLGGVRSFMAVQAGATMTVPPDTETASALLGAMHYQDAAPGTDFLPDLGNGHLGAIGFTGDLPSGTYTFWIQDTSHEPGLAYSFVLEVSAVPEPDSVALMLGGLGLLAAMGRQHRRAASPTA